VHTQVTDVRVHEHTGRLRQEHLPAVADGGDACALVHVEADVALVRQPWLARVQPHPHTYRPASRPSRERRATTQNGRRSRLCLASNPTGAISAAITEGSDGLQGRKKRMPAVSTTAVVSEPGKLNLAGAPGPR
jgi:hypothetical protein